MTLADARIKFIDRIALQALSYLEQGARLKSLEMMGMQDIDAQVMLNETLMDFANNVTDRLTREEFLYLLSSIKAQDKLEVGLMWPYRGRMASLSLGANRLQQL